MLETTNYFLVKNREKTRQKQPNYVIVYIVMIQINSK